MQTVKSLKEIGVIIADTLTKDFANVKILGVKVTSQSETEDDGSYLNVEVTFEGTPKKLDARAALDAVDDVRPKLRAAGVDAFPIFSFVSRSEPRGKALAAG